MRRWTPVLLVVIAVAGLSVSVARRPPRQKPAATAGATPPQPVDQGVSADPVPVVTRTIGEVGLAPGAIDRDVDPCSDFHRFACGSWIGTDEARRWNHGFRALAEENKRRMRALLQEATEYVGDDPMLRRIADFHAACLDADAIRAAWTQPLETHLRAIDAVEDLEGFASLVARLHRIDVPVLFQTAIDRDPDDLRMMRAILHPNPFRYTRGGHRPANRVSLTGQRGMAGMAAGQARRTFHSFGYDPDVARRAATDAARIHERFIVDPIPARRMERASLRAEVPLFDWDRYFLDLGHPEWDAVFVEPQTLETVEEALSVESIPALRHYATFILLETFVFDAVYGRTDVDERWESRRPELCLQETARVFEEDLGALYVQRHFPTHARIVAWGMAGSIAEELRDGLESSAFLDETSGAAVRRRLDEMALLIGHADRQPSYAFTPRREARLWNRLEVGRLRVADRLGSVNRPADRWKWPWPPSYVNAAYLNANDALVFPAGILAKPFFEPERPSVANYGAIGSIMGHELTHGLLPPGPRDGWTVSARESFERVEGCMIDGFPGYGSGADPRDEGRFTLPENLADFGGATLAWRAWKRARPFERQPPFVADGFTEDEVFFLAYAQMYCEDGRRQPSPGSRHAPRPVRVNGTLSQMPEFAETFRCPTGSRMNAAPRCTIW